MRTNVLANNAMPFWMVWGFWLLGPLIAQPAERYAEVPFFLAANPEGRKLVEREGGRWNEKLRKLPCAPALKDEETQRVVWEWLVGKMAR